MPTTELPSQALALEPFTQAFALWEDEFRKSPDSFLTSEEVARMAVAPLSEQRAICLLAFMRKIGAVPPPFPGQYWPEQQGHYAGIQLGADRTTAWHLILPDAPEHYFENLPWGERGQDVAGATCAHDGLANTIAMAAAGSDLAQRIRALPGDCYLPGRFEAALIYASLHDRVKLDSWHWTSTQYNASSAWICDFSDGHQISSRKSYEGSAVAVRRLVIQSFNPLGE